MRVVDYPENYEASLHALKYPSQYPYFSCLLPQQLRHYHSGVAHKHAIVFNTVFDLAIHLSLMGLDEHVNALHTLFESKGPIHRKEAIEQSLRSLYDLFEQLSDNPKLIDHQKDLKNLKKLIHAFAEENNLDPELFNLKKLWDFHLHPDREDNEESYKQLTQLWKQENDFSQRQLTFRLNACRSLPENEPYALRLKRLRALQDDFEERKATLDELRTALGDDFPGALEGAFKTCLTTLIKTPASLEIDEEKLHNVFQPYSDELNTLWNKLSKQHQLHPPTVRRLRHLKRGALPTQIYTTLDQLRRFASEPLLDATALTYRNKEKKSHRQEAKQWINIISFFASFTVGVSEGAIAAVFALATLPPWFAFLVIGTSGFICNYYLFRNDSLNILKDIKSERIWEKMNGEQLSREEKIGVSISLFFSFSAAVSYGFLSIDSGITAYTTLLTLMGVSPHPVGIAVLSGFIALVTTIALFTLFAYLTINFVRRGSLASYGRHWVNLKRDCIDFFSYEGSLSRAEIGLHYAQKIGEAIFNFSLAALAVLAIVVINVTTTGLFLHHAQIMLKGLGQATANILAWIITVGFGAVANTAFYINSILCAGSAAVEALTRTASAIYHLPTTLKTGMESENAPKEPKIPEIYAHITSLKRCFFFTCAMFNAYGHAEGVCTDSTAQRWIHHTIPLGNGAVGLIAGAGSFGANIKASFDATKPPSTVKDSPRFFSSKSTAKGPAPFASIEARKPLLLT